MATTAPETGPEPTTRKANRQVQLGPLSTEELERASTDGALVVIPASCCCVVQDEVFGKLIVL